MNTPYIIPFNKPYIEVNTTSEVMQALSQDYLGSAALNQALRNRFLKELNLSDTQQLYFTQSATQALEIMALTLNLKPDDEVILPSYTYAATANAFAKVGAKLVFADVCPDTVNIHPKTVEDLMTARTKAILPIHYGGYAADMDAFQKVVDGTDIQLLEDAAHGIGSTYKHQALGTIGTMGCLSFHHTKNISSGGWGGCLYVNPELSHSIAHCDSPIIEEIMEQGTDKRAFLKGQISNYKWNRLGGEYEMQPYNKIALNFAIANLNQITQKRKQLSERYLQLLMDGLALELSEGMIRLPSKIDGASENGHIFYIIVHSLKERQGLQTHLLNNGISAYTHYEPLHVSKAGLAYGTFQGQMKGTQLISDGLLRLPMFYELTEREQEYIVSQIVTYFKRLRNRLR